MSITKVNAAAFLAVALAFFAWGQVASAASITNVEFSNGDVTVEGKAGQSIGGKVRVVVGPGEVVEKMEFDVSGDSLAPVCVEVGGEKGLEEGTHFVSIPSDLKFPPNTGTYSLEVKGSGIFGAFKTVDCTSNVVGTATFGGAVKTVGVGSGSSVGGSGTTFADLLAMIKELTLQITALKTPPVANAKCVTLATKLAGTVYGANAPANVVLQGYLLSEGASIPALTAGAAFGFYGSQTAAAVTWFKATNACQ